MSGGSFNYLGFKEIEQLPNNIEELTEMAKRLAELGYEDLALNTFCIVKDIEFFFNDLQERKNKLENAWLNVEWLESGDYGEETFKQKMKEQGYEK